MSILKDAEAVKIYGEEGANGVILIETRSGSKGNNSIRPKDRNANFKVTRPLPRTPCQNGNTKNIRLHGYIRSLPPGIIADLNKFPIQEIPGPANTQSKKYPIQAIPDPGNTRLEIQIRQIPKIQIRRLYISEKYRSEKYTSEKYTSEKYTSEKYTSEKYRSKNIGSEKSQCEKSQKNK